MVAVAATLLAACDMEIGDLNNPSVSELESAPTPALVRSAATGLLIGHRNRMAIDDGYVATLGVLGREALIFAASDPGFITELLQKEPGLDPGSVISGGDFWRDRYASKNLFRPPSSICAPIVANSNPPRRMISAVEFGETFASMPPSHWNPMKLIKATLVTPLSAAIIPYFGFDLFGWRTCRLREGRAIGYAFKHDAPSNGAKTGCRSAGGRDIERVTRKVDWPCCVGE